MCRLVRFLQVRVRAHSSVNHCRATLLGLWFQRHLPVLLLHVRIVAAGRGLDLKNLTVHDREHIYQAQHHFLHEYRHVSHDPVQHTQPPPDRDTHHSHEHHGTGSRRNSHGGGELLVQGAPPKRLKASFSPSTKGQAAAADYNKLDASLLRQMNSVEFHTFLRTHLDQIANCEFLHHHAPAAEAFPGHHHHHHTSAVGMYSGAALHTTATVRHHAESRRAILNSLLLSLVCRKRREYMLSSSKKPETVYQTLAITLEDARKFVRGDADPVREHLQELHLKEELNRAQHRKRRVGTRGGPAIIKRSSVLDEPGAQSSPPPVRPQPPPSHPTAPIPSSPRRKDHRVKLERGTSLKGGRESPVQLGELDRGVSFKGPSSPVSLSRGNSFKYPPSPSAGSLSRGSSFKRSAGRSAPSSAPAQQQEMDPTSLLARLSALPLPPVFLLLKSVTAQEMTLLFCEAADQLRRRALAEKMRKRASIATPAATSSVEPPAAYTGNPLTHTKQRSFSMLTPDLLREPMRQPGPRHLSAFEGHSAGRRESASIAAGGTSHPYAPDRSRHSNSSTTPLQRRTNYEIHIA